MKYLLLILCIGLSACVPANNPPSSIPPLAGVWLGKDPSDGSNITLTLTPSAALRTRFTLIATDDATQAWCGTGAIGSATGDLDANNQLPLSVVWQCNDRSKAAQTYPTTIRYNSQNDTLVAYEAVFSRVR